MKNNHLIKRSPTETPDVSDATLRNWTRLGVGVEEQKTKLTTRANKRYSRKAFLPEEYVTDTSHLAVIDQIISFSRDNRLDTQTVLFLCVKNLRELSDHPIFHREIDAWLNEIDQSKMVHLDWFATHLPQNIEGDFLGLLYQSLLSEGNKTKSGSYYTPQTIAGEMADEMCSRNDLILDPACGTGQFLLEAANIVEKPTQLYGIDSDSTAVRICRINLIKRFSGMIFEPQVYCANSLLDFGTKTLFTELHPNLPIGHFDVVMTNPPWGGHWNRKEKLELSKRFPQIGSGESFSFFLVQAMKFAKKGGKISFLLPESILNIKVHSDIREYLAESFTVKKILPLGRPFNGVFSSVIRLDVLNEKSKRPRSSEAVFSIFQNEKDRSLLKKIEQKPFLTLKGQAQFALGIVTGNNEKHLLATPDLDAEPIFRGKDVDTFFLKPASQHIVFQPKQYQQVAPEKLFRAKEKLIYRFISKNLVFAYDHRQRLTLNSANILIPSIPDYPMKVVCAVLNSNVLRYLYRKKFNTIKVLRADLESLPIPDLSKTSKSTILALGDAFVKNGQGNIMDEVNRILYEYYELSPEEIDQITEFLEKN